MYDASCGSVGTGPASQPTSASAATSAAVDTTTRSIITRPSFLADGISTIFTPKSATLGPRPSSVAILLPLFVSRPITVSRLARGRDFRWWRMIGAMHRHLPAGTVTFVFTDIEGSTRLLHELGGQGYAAALAEHRQIM